MVISNLAFYAKRAKPLHVSVIEEKDRFEITCNNGANHSSHLEFSFSNKIPPKFRTALEVVKKYAEQRPSGIFIHVGVFQNDFGVSFSLAFELRTVKYVFEKKGDYYSFQKRDKIRKTFDGEINEKFEN